MKEEYKELFVDKEFDRKVLADAVKPFIRFTDEGKIVYLDNFSNLSIARKIICVLLAKKILYDVEKSKDEKMDMKELVSKIGTKRSTIEGQLYGKLKQLVMAEGGNFWVPTYNIMKAKNFLCGKNDKTAEENENKK